MTTLVKRHSLILPLVLALMAVVAMAIAIAIGTGGTARAASGEVLILSTTITGDATTSREGQAISAAGKTPVVVDPTVWSTMTAAQFASYDAIVLGDPTCSIDESIMSAAMANASVWGTILDGNVIIIGSDPVYHFNSEVGAQKLVNQGIAFAVDEPGKTGAYLDLSCYYHFSGSGTPVPVLDGINGGGFTVIGASNLPGLNDVHIVATHPSLAGLTDADLSNWGNSVHEGFETWPIEFEALAIARDSSGSYTASDGTVGYPYILARGEGLVVISDIQLSPDGAVNPIGTEHTVTATVVEDDAPVEGVTVDFTIVAGPHVGTTGSVVTDIAGVATFSYTGTSVGVDTIQATFVDSLDRTQSSNKVTKEWIEAPEPQDIEVSLDIHPTSCPNPLNVGKNGVLPVAILGTEDFDASQVDPASVQLEGISPLRWAIEDVTTPYEGELADELSCTTEEADGYDDLTLKFDAQEVAAALGEVGDGDVLVLTLTGQLWDGTPITGEDVVIILEKGK